VVVGNLTINNTTASTSTVTGALLMGGGAGIAGNINIGGTTNYFAGNVGIGIVAPLSKLHVEGTTSGNGAGPDAIAYFKQNGTWTGAEPWALYVDGYSYLNGFRINAADGIRSLYKTTAGGSLGFATTGDDPITFTQLDNTERMRIAAGGFVGIGTTTPLSTLDVNGNVGIRGVISATDTATVNSLTSNIFGRFGQNVTVNSTNASTSTGTGALVVAGGAGIAGNLYVGSNVVAAGFNYTNGQGPGYTDVLDDISIYFNGVTQVFNLTVSGSTVSPKNPNLLQIWIGGVNIYPARYVTDVQNLPSVPTFTRGFVIYNNTIIFATAPQQYMDFYGTIRTNNDVMPAYTYNQSQFSAINIMMAY
jgi:hypothetical protein